MGGKIYVSTIDSFCCIFVHPEKAMTNNTMQKIFLPMNLSKNITIMYLLLLLNVCVF